MEPLIQGIRDPLAVPLAFAVCAVSGALNAASASRQMLAAAVASLTLITPWAASPDATIIRAVCSGATVLVVLRGLDLFRESPPLSAVRRALHVISVFDSRRVRRTAPAFDRISWLRFVGFGVPTLFSTWMLVEVGTPSKLSDYAARFLWGAFWTYTSMETVTALIRASARLCGAQPPKLHDNPILSRTLLEFWGQRWNLSVHQMLHNHCFRPLVRSVNVPMAILGTFTASALLHFWLVLAAEGYLMALSIGAYFLLQGPFVIAEQFLGVRRWPRPIQHLWVVGGVVLPLPLLLEPLLRVAFG